MTIERARKFWTCASTFPGDKESVYPEHKVAQRFDELKGTEHVLEYGCGGGSDAMSYLRRGCRVTFVDIVGGNVQKARERIEAAGLGARATGLMLAKSDEIGGEDDAYDVVSSHGVIHHIEEPLPVMRELHRLLKPRGMLTVMLYTEKLEKSFNDRIVQIMKEGVSKEEAFGWCTDGRGCPYARSYTVNEGTVLLERAGFAVLSFYEYEKGNFRTFLGTKIPGHYMCAS